MIFAAAAPGLTKYKRARGFSLIELLVVIIIVSIVVSFTTLAIRGSDPDDLINTEAQRFNQLLELALEEATFKGLSYGIVFTPTSYTFVYLNDKNQWEALSGDQQLRKRQLEHNIQIDLEYSQNTDTKPADNKEQKLAPQVLLYSSGEIDPAFTAYFSIPGSNISYQVDGHSNGQHDVKKTR